MDNQELSAVDERGNGVKVVFAREGDRWGHSLWRLAAGEEPTLLFESVEGDAADPWPASPPLQELSREMLPDGRDVIFLVGRAGTSHWSASVEAASDPPRIVFDIACRHSQTPEGLCSAYRREGEGSIAPVEEGTAICESPFLITAQPMHKAEKLPGTTRWKYEVR